MNRNVKYKQICKLSLFGDDDVNTTASSAYSISTSYLPGVTLSGGGANYNASNIKINVSGGGGTGAVIIPTIASGVITALNLANAGRGFVNKPNISISSGVNNVASLVGGSGYRTDATQIYVSGGNGNGAVITPSVITAGSISALTITSSGSDYTSVPSISIRSGITGYTLTSGGTGYKNSFNVDVSGGGGSDSVVTGTASNGVITSISIDKAGVGYTSIPTFTFPKEVTNYTSLVGGSNYFGNVECTVSGGGGSGCVVAPVVSAGVITDLTIIDGGTGYTSAPTISFPSGLTSYTIVNGGTGFTNGPFFVVVSGGGGSGAIVTGSALLGVIQGFNIINPGSGYTSTPTFDCSMGSGTGENITPLFGSGASATLVISSGANITAKIGSGASVNAVIGSGANINVNGFITNSKRMRFPLNNSLNDIKLSQNARCVVQSCNIPSLTNMAGKCVILRMVVSSQDKICDSKKYLSGNPVLLTMATLTTVGTPNVLFNGSEFFYNLNVPTNILSQGYLEVELECPAATVNVDYITSKPLTPFFLNLVIVDEDMELTKDLTLAPPIDYKHYNTNVPIRQY